MNVLHLPTSVGGNSWGLAQSEKALGLNSVVLCRTNTWLDYPADIQLEWNEKKPIITLFKAFKTFFEIRNKYDVFHFNFGTSVIDLYKWGLPTLDIPYYPKNKKLIFSFNGCDARQKYETIQRTEFSACNEHNCYNGICNNKKFEELKRKRIRKIEKYADHIFALNPDLMWVLPSKTTFLPYAIPQWEKIETCPLHPDKTIKILHAPTDRGAKGSEYIISALRNLEKKYNLEIILIENTPHNKAIEMFKQADLVIDQVLVGWYGGFAVEMMKMGKPVAAFIRKDDLRFIPPRMAEDLSDAIINITPTNIEQTLSYFLENTTELQRKRQAALDYVHKWHNPEYVAGITKSVYER